MIRDAIFDFGHAPPLGHDDHPNVGSLIGYSNRKFSDYKFCRSGTSAR
jgi:hypothetical protein